MKLIHSAKEVKVETPKDLIDSAKKDIARQVSIRFDTTMLKMRKILKDAGEFNVYSAGNTEK